MNTDFTGRTAIVTGAAHGFGRAISIALAGRFGSQEKAARAMDIPESRLSRLVDGDIEPSFDERRRLAVQLGADYFAPDGNRIRAE